jgi:hypothetical protein
MNAAQQQARADRLRRPLSLRVVGQTGCMDRAYENRLTAGTYRDDVQCQLRLQPDPRDNARQPIEDWISERLLTRLRHLALAYDLPLLSRLPANGAIAYPEIQLSSVEDELALLQAIAPIQAMISRATNEPRGWSLVVEAP